MASCCKHGNAKASRDTKELEEQDQSRSPELRGQTQVLKPMLNLLSMREGDFIFPQTEPTPGPTVWWAECHQVSGCPSPQLGTSLWQRVLLPAPSHPGQVTAGLCHGLVPC